MISGPDMKKEQKIVIKMLPHPWSSVKSIHGPGSWWLCGETTCDRVMEDRRTLGQRLKLVREI